MLDGLGWGYRGSGASGLATILADLEKFPDVGSALDWVAGLNDKKGWART